MTLWQRHDTVSDGAATGLIGLCVGVFVGTYIGGPSLVGCGVTVSNGAAKGLVG